MFESSRPDCARRSCLSVGGLFTFLSIGLRRQVELGFVGRGPRCGRKVKNELRPPKLVSSVGGLRASTLTASRLSFSGGASFSASVRAKPSLMFKSLGIMWTVYIRKCSDGIFYTGCTSDLDDLPEGRLKRQPKRLPFLLIGHLREMI